MDSIDRLREYVYDMTNVGSMTKANMSIYIDAIEQEVEDNERFRREAEPFHDRLCRASERREDVTLWGVDYMPYPLDADGEPIHVGDVMEWPDTSTAEVVGIGDDRFFYADDGLRYAWASDKIHHHAPTVEDVLREFADIVRKERVELATISEDTIAEFAAKLRLAGDE